MKRLLAKAVLAGLATAGLSLSAQATYTIQVQVFGDNVAQKVNDGVANNNIMIGTDTSPGADVNELRGAPPDVGTAPPDDGIFHTLNVVAGIDPTPF